jgi:hypothetical protein
VKRDLSKIKKALELDDDAPAVTHETGVLMRHDPETGQLERVDASSDDVSGATAYTVLTGLTAMILIPDNGRDPPLEE